MENVRRCVCITCNRATHFPRSTLGPVQWRPLLGFAEVRVVRVTAPQLLARVERTKLKEQEKMEVTYSTSTLQIYAITTATAAKKISSVTSPTSKVNSSCDTLHVYWITHYMLCK